MWLEIVAGVSHEVSLLRDNFLQKKNSGSFIVLHAIYMYLTWNTRFKENVSKELKSYFHVSFNSSDNYAEQLFKSMTTKDGRTYEAMMLGLIKV